MSQVQDEQVDQPQGESEFEPMSTADFIFGNDEGEEDEQAEESTEAEEGADDDAKADADDGTKEDDSDAATTIRVGDEDLSIEDAASRLNDWCELQDLVRQSYGDEGASATGMKAVVEMGLTYADAMKVFEGSASGAEQVLSVMQAAAIEKYGPKLKYEPLDLKNLSADDFDGRELSLYGMLQAAQNENNELRGRNQDLVNQARQLSEKLADVEKGPSLVERVKAKFPKAEVTAESLRAMMTKHEIADPVKAFIVDEAERGNTVSAGGGSPGGAEAERPKPKAPKASSASAMFDPTGLTADEIARRLEAGQVVQR